MGAVFSPAYYRQRQRQPQVDPWHHCGINAVLYDRQAPRKGRWAMTYVPRALVKAAPHRLQIANALLSRSGGSLEVTLDERCAPFGQALRGRVSLVSRAGAKAPYVLDDEREHGWWPLAALAQVRVELAEPALCFEGHGYHDCNFGSVPLEQSFARWNWSRAALGEGAAILYDTMLHSGAAKQLGLHIQPGTEPSPLSAAHAVSLGKGRWGVEDYTRTDSPEAKVRMLHRLEDTPFYNRSIIQTHLQGQSCEAMHESLDLARFERPWVRFLLPFRTRNFA